METDINTLNIIGYNDVLDRNSLPVVVPPVFLDSKDNVLFPPFTISGSSVKGGTWSNLTRWKQLVSISEATEIETIEARPDHELWVKLDGEVCYELRYEVCKQLLIIASQYLNSARELFNQGNFTEAMRSAEISFNADTSQAEPLAVKASVRYMEGNVNVVNFLRDTASCPEEFDRKLHEYISYV